jgi:hypothetical protein
MYVCAVKNNTHKMHIPGDQDDAVEGGENVTLHSTLALPTSGPTGSNEATSNGREIWELGSGLALKADGAGWPSRHISFSSERVQGHAANIKQTSHESFGNQLIARQMKHLQHCSSRKRCPRMIGVDEILRSGNRWLVDEGHFF